MDIMPLANKLRPKSIDDILGQDHILGKDKLLYRLIKADRIFSIILYGPPGTGKTSIAMAIANETALPFESLNATTASKKDMQRITDKNTRLILFIDEIHRFNKAQQDYLLPFVEKGQIILIGATTENPYFSVNQALLSRSTIFELKPIDDVSMRKLIQKTIDSIDDTVELTNNAADLLINYANGDARRAISAIELAVLTTQSVNTKITITDTIIADCMQKSALKYDSDGDNHYDITSAFIKSIRGSDPQAALYYLALMLNSGEDILFIARRLIISASEDIGLADSNALNITVSSFVACKNIGLPEARIILSHAVIYLATAPKSNSAYTAIDKAYAFVNTHKTGTIPDYLKDAHYKQASNLNHGVGYKYPHDYQNHYVAQQYLPNEYKNLIFYTPENNKNERIIQDYMSYLDYVNKQ